MSRVRWIVWLLALIGLASTQAAAQEQRCEGTLCDLYYRNAPPPAPAQPGAPAPAPAPAPHYLGDMFGFMKPAAPAAPGAAAAPQPQQATRCEGTLCDLYYGGPTEREKAWPNAPPAAPAVAPAPVRAAAPTGRYNAADTAKEEAERDTFVERPQPTFCAGTKADPWKCFR